MDFPRNDDHSARIEYLERELRSLKRANHRWRGCTLAVALGALTLFGAGALQPDRQKIVQAERFSLCDEDGKERASLSVAADNSAGLVFHDEKGLPRVFLGRLPDGSTRLSFIDANLKNRINVGGERDGVPLLEALTKPRHY